MASDNATTAGSRHCGVLSPGRKPFLPASTALTDSMPRLLTVCVVIYLLCWQPAFANLASPVSPTTPNPALAAPAQKQAHNGDANGTEQAAQTNTQALTQSHRGDSATVEVVINRRVMGIAEFLRYTLTVVTDTDANVEFEAVNDNLGPFRVVEYNPFGPIKLEGEKLRWQREYVLEAQSAGELVIPSLDISFFPPVADCLTADSCEMTAHGRRSDRRDPKPALYQVQTDAVSIEVQTVLDADVDLTKPKDVQPPIALASMVGGAGSSINLLAIILLGTMVLFTVMYLRRRQPAAQPVDTVDHNNPSPRHTALAALAQLRHDQLPQRGELQAHYVRLSQILRRYVADGFNVRALERTSKEIIDSLEHNPRLQQHHRAIARLLNINDLAKFAGSYPDPDEQDLIDQVEAIIDETSTDDNGATR